MPHLVQTTIMIFPDSPLIWVKASPTAINRGEKILITGCAQGHPSKGLHIWIFGKNYTSLKNIEIDNQETFAYEMSQEDTKNLDPGVYYGIVQHPMGDGIFNIDQCLANPNDTCNIQTSGQKKIFTMVGPGSIVGADAADALVAGIKEPNVDDTSLVFQFSVIGSVTTTPTTVPTSSPTTLVTITPTNAVTISSTTQITAIPTAETTIPQTNVSTTPPISPVTTVSTNNIEKLLEEQNKKIDEQNKLIAEQNKKIEEQSDLLSQLLSYLKGIFGWK